MDCLLLRGAVSTIIEGSKFNILVHNIHTVSYAPSWPHTISTKMQRSTEAKCHYSPREGVRDTCALYQNVFSQRTNYNSFKLHSHFVHKTTTSNHSVKFDETKIRPTYQTRHSLIGHIYNPCVHVSIVSRIILYERVCTNFNHRRSYTHR